MYFTDKILAAHIAAADVIVFDMNGTIVDDEPVYHRAANDVLAPHGFAMKQEEYAIRCVGIKTKLWMAEFMPHLAAAEVQALVDARDSVYEDNIAGGRIRALVRPGALDLMRFAADHPTKKLALATSSPPRNVEFILGPQGLGVSGLFDFVITGRDVKKAKPDPEIYHGVRAAFPAARNFLVIEDTWAGITAAKAAGMTCLAFPSDYTRVQNHAAADAIIDSLLPSARGGLI
jgi:beta-phosphoglucomutase-like phosphatase (HAD superfamily)